MGAENPVIRRLYGKKRLRSDVFMKLFGFEMKHQYKQKLDKMLGKQPIEMVVQDVEIPIQNCEKFLEYYLKTIPILPAWVCPVRQIDSKVDWSLYNVDPKKLYVNFGFWSGVPAKKSDSAWHNTSLEAKVTELKGKKSLYSDAYYDEKTFWRLYNKKQYDILKTLFDPHGSFKNLYQKTVKRG
jgi:FAD/FMN-containing dehydrogenase